MEVSILLGNPWLGHGRKAEALVGMIAFLYGTFILISPTDSQAIRDLAWEGYAPIVAVLFFANSALTISGVVLNVLGWCCSRWFRLAGVLLGSFLLSWMLSQFHRAGVPFTWGSACAVGFLILNATIVGSIWSDLPKPGTPGSR